ncbi:MAG: hypothetical protein QF516_01340, partial [Pirellulaceae bacterium]|nr:hypothetical protein [Pirellulaceae bacterium]
EARAASFGLACRMKRDQFTPRGKPFLRQWRRSLTSEWYGPHANFTTHACYRESPSLSTHKPNRYRHIHAI